MKKYLFKAHYWRKGANPFWVHSPPMRDAYYKEISLDSKQYTDNEIIKLAKEDAQEGFRLYSLTKDGNELIKNSKIKKSPKRMADLLLEKDNQ